MRRLAAHESPQRHTAGHWRCETRLYLCSAGGRDEPSEATADQPSEVLCEQEIDVVSSRPQLGRDELDVSRHAPRTIVRQICVPAGCSHQTPNNCSNAVLVRVPTATTGRRSAASNYQSHTKYFSPIMMNIKIRMSLAFNPRHPDQGPIGRAPGAARAPPHTRGRFAHPFAPS